jgi:hypothetical protein
MVAGILIGFILTWFFVWFGLVLDSTLKAREEKAEKTKEPTTFERNLSNLLTLSEEAKKSRRKK